MKPTPMLERRLVDYCRARIDPQLAPREAQRVRLYLLGLLGERRGPPRVAGAFDWVAISLACGIDLERVSAFEHLLRPGLLALHQAFPSRAAKAQQARRPLVAAGAPSADRALLRPSADGASPPPKRRGRPVAPYVEWPKATPGDWDDPPKFADALTLHMKRHSEGGRALHRAIVRPGETFDITTLYVWRRGEKEPQSSVAMAILARIEQRYRLPAGYFKAKLAHPGRATVGQQMPGISAAERRRIDWHLPDDFDQRPPREQEDILRWVRTVVVSGSTDYRRYQATATRVRFALRFPGLTIRQPVPKRRPQPVGAEIDPDDPMLSPGTVTAPTALMEDMRSLVRFKTATLTTSGYQRSGVWGEETAAQKVEHLGLLFGALAASPKGAVRGYGATLQDLSLAHLVFPAVWDWYVQWREHRRGFYTAWEVDMLNVAAALTRQSTGWLRQTPSMSDRLRPIPGLVTDADIEQVRLDWDAACERMHSHALGRSKEIKRVKRIHRDPFEPILVVLEADSPVAEYRKITEEILRRMPDEQRYPIAAAEATRAFLMLRLGLHLGLRQKNLRQLLICERGKAPTQERRLVDLKRGELRWSDRNSGWEVFIPAVAFKNSGSTFFGSKPFRLILPDLAGLYAQIDAYVDKHRPRLLRGVSDPGVLFVKSVSRRSLDAAYDQTTFYEAWRWAIQRYGIYNPYTKRGAIKGLLPHGPHNIRDVLATHILKKTGSYEQASYAIQDTPEMVAQHYGRFLPQDKAAIAAKVLNEVWNAA